jgi:hypothetical protein
VRSVDEILSRPAPAAEPIRRQIEQILRQPVQARPRSTHGRCETCGNRRYVERGPLDEGDAGGFIECPTCSEE